MPKTHRSRLTLILAIWSTCPGRFPGELIEIRYGSIKGLRHGRVLDRTLHYPAFAERVGRAVAEHVRAGSVDLVDAQGLTALGYGRLRRRDPSLLAPLVMNPQGMEEHKTRGLKRLADACGRARDLDVLIVDIQERLPHCGGSRAAALTWMLERAEAERAQLQPGLRRDLQAFCASGLLEDLVATLSRRPARLSERGG